MVANTLPRLDPSRTAPFSLAPDAAALSVALDVLQGKSEMSFQTLVIPVVVKSIIAVVLLSLSG